MMDYAMLSIGYVLLFLLALGALAFFMVWGVLALHRYYQHKYAEDHLDEELAKHMGYKNYPFMDMYDD